VNENNIASLKSESISYQEAKSATFPIGMLKKFCGQLLLLKKNPDKTYDNPVNVL